MKILSAQAVIKTIVLVQRVNGDLEHYIFDGDHTKGLDEIDQCLDENEEPNGES